MYDEDGNFIGEVEDEGDAKEKKGKGKKVKKGKGKKRKFEAVDEGDESDGGAAVVNPFVDEEEPVVRQAAPAGTEDRILGEVDNDKLGDDALVQKGKTEQDKKREAFEARRKKEYLDKMAQRTAMLEQEKKERKKAAKPVSNPMGHFVHEASVDKGLVSDGIYQWSNMGLGKMPLKVKKQWQLTSEDVPTSSKRSRKSGYIPRD
eukprot:TRINITY_DN4057_c0_g1_i1.p2 TRINITY_DN4057_c0_g1~~TRINITY_DN4057_c0_g1_i1.p2  ORF type:complete len:204 (+),score=106.64 TRINITY_DN4057_c0_g1_i1:69-680(+)